MGSFKRDIAPGTILHAETRNKKSPQKQLRQQ